ncbi:MAG: hypothetical protein HFG02_06990 [Oscillibacter sp.]|nr:hypothetical protein [Oscillibacter sp.]
MEYQDFEKFYRTDPVTFHLGMELLEGRGRDALSASTDQALCSAVTKKLSELLTADKILAVIKAARDFAGLSAVERLSYAARCGIRLEDDPVDEPEVCPLCGGSLRYGEYEMMDESRIQNWTCEKCGATGKEAYRMEFDCHYHVRNGKGDLVDRQK